MKRLQYDGFSLKLPAIVRSPFNLSSTQILRTVGTVSVRAKLEAFDSREQYF